MHIGHPIAWLTCFLAAADNEHMRMQERDAARQQSDTHAEVRGCTY